MFNQFKFLVLFLSLVFSNGFCFAMYLFDSVNYVTESFVENENETYRILIGSCKNGDVIQCIRYIKGKNAKTYTCCIECNDETIGCLIRYEGKEALEYYEMLQKKLKQIQAPKKRKS